MESLKRSADAENSLPLKKRQKKQVESEVKLNDIFDLLSHTNQLIVELHSKLDQKNNTPEKKRQRSFVHKELTPSQKAELQTLGLPITDIVGMEQVENSMDDLTVLIQIVSSDLIER